MKTTGSAQRHLPSWVPVEKPPLGPRRPLALLGKQVEFTTTAPGEVRHGRLRSLASDGFMVIEETRGNGVVDSYYNLGRIVWIRERKDET